MVLRAAKNKFSLDVSQGRYFTTHPENEGNRLQLHRPDSYLGGPLHGTQSNDKSIAVPSNQWFTLRWRITAAGMKLWIDGQVIYEKADVLELTERWPVQITVDDASIEMKSLVINRARDK